MDSEVAKEKGFDLEQRLIAFAVRVMKVAEALPKTLAGQHVRGQILRSGTSPAPNYGEAQAAESRSDFIHKLKIVVKELRETRVWLRMIRSAEMIEPAAKLEPLIAENNELIAIFVKSIQTATKNQAE